MNGTQGNRKNLIEMLGMAALVVVLVFAAQLVFQVLGMMGTQKEPSPFTSLNKEDGQLQPYGLRLLGEEEGQASDIRGWLESARDQMSGENATKEHSVFWLYRQSTDEYVLYLPDQDRAVSAADLTADEEGDQDGEITLVLRVRTPEGGEEIVPEEQLFSIQTRSEQWKGIRVKVILDGRERHVYKLTSRDDRLYSTEEMYIGRDREDG